MEAGGGLRISDETVTLRSFTLDDVNDVTAACQDPEIIRWTTIPSPYTENHARAFITMHDDLRREGLAYHFAIVAQTEVRLSGAISVEGLKVVSGSATVGYWVAPWARRRGLASRALELLSTWAFPYFGLDRLTLTTLVGNVASERVAERCGYVLVEEITDDNEPETSRLRYSRRWTRIAAA